MKYNNELIADYLKANGISRKQVIKETGIAKGYMSMLMSGERPINDATALKLDAFFKRLGVDPGSMKKKSIEVVKVSPAATIPQVKQSAPDSDKEARLAKAMAAGGGMVTLAGDNSNKNYPNATLISPFGTSKPQVYDFEQDPTYIAEAIEMRKNSEARPESRQRVLAAAIAAANRYGDKTVEDWLNKSMVE